MTGVRNPVPALTALAEEPATMRRQIHQWAKQVSPVMYGVAGAIIGTLPVPPAPSNAYLMQTATIQTAFTSGGSAITFPHPFPNGLVSILLSVLTGAAANTSYENPTPAGFVAILYISGSLYTGNADVSYTAIGW